MGSTPSSASNPEEDILNVSNQENAINNQGNGEENGTLIDRVDLNAKVIKKGTAKKKNKPHAVTPEEWTAIGNVLSNVIQKNASLTQAMDKLARHVFLLDVEEDTHIMNKGGAAEGLYIVHQGELHVMSESEEDTVLYVLKQGQCCGDVEIIYRVPATLTVKASTGTTLLFIPTSRLRPLVSRGRTRADYCAQMRHLPAVSDVSDSVWREKLLLSVLSWVPVFSEWTQEQLVSLVSSMPQYPVMVHPPGSLVMAEGDHTHRLLVLVKGSVSVYADGNFITKFLSYKLPFLMAEEDLFIDDGVALTLVADEPTWIVRIQTDWLEETVSNDEELTKAWEKRRARWESLLHKRDPILNTRFTGLLQVEIVYKWLRESDIFVVCSPNCVYAIALLAEPELLNGGQLDTKKDEYLMLIIVLESAAGRQYGALKSVNMCSHRHPWTSEESGTSDIVLALWFDTSAVEETIGLYPGSRLVLDKKPQFRDD